MWKLRIITVSGLSLTTLEFFSFSAVVEARIVTILGLTIASISLWALMELLADTAEFRDRPMTESDVSLWSHVPRH